MKIYNILIKLSFALVLIFGITACGDDEDTSQYYQENLRDLTVADYIESSARTQGASYNTLYEALVKADLLGALASGEVTLFAPTDDAFAAAGIDIRDVDAATLANILTYHVVSGSVESDAVVGKLTTVQGATFNADGTCLNGTTGITNVDVNVSNGVIHTIDNVLMPPSGDIMDKIAEMSGATSPELTLLENALIKSGLNATLAGTTDYTLFAPTDAAMTAAGIDQATIDALTAQQLADVLLFHVLAGNNFSCAIESGRVATAAGALDVIQGVDIEAGDAITVNGAEVTSADILASNGVIHIVDEVIFPEITILDGTGPSVEVSGFDFLTFDPIHAAFVRLGYDVGLLNDYVNEYTVYGPCCGSFSEASYPNDADLKAVVDAHIFEGIVDIAAVAAEGGAEITSIGGDRYYVTTSDNGVFVNGSTSNAFGSTSGVSFPVYNGLLITTFPALNPLPAESVVDLMAADANYDLFAAALTKLGLGSDSDITIFALDNATFTAIFGYATVAEVDAAAAEDFDGIENHIAGGVYFGVDLDDGTPPSIDTNDGNNTLNFAYVDGSLAIIPDPSIIGEVNITGADDFTGSNGVVHTVDGVISF